MAEQFLPVLRDVGFHFGARQVLRCATLTLKRGNINCLLGPSGCGKSTLLRVVAGLLPPRFGHVLVDPGQCAMVFQDSRLLRWLTVEENLMLALIGSKSSAQTERIRHMLELVQLPDAMHLFPHELSGGMAQRAGIARALLRSPQLLLMDEPFAALDAITRRELQASLQDLIATQHITCLFVTHDVNEAMALGQRLFVMRNGQITHQWDAPWSASDLHPQIIHALNTPNAVEHEPSLDAAS